MTTDHLIIGAGIFGICAAIELRRRGHTVVVLNPGKIPHPLASSTDISKAVRMEYGSDEEYMDMAHECILAWREWNQSLGETIFHETGYLVLANQPIECGQQPFEKSSLDLLLQKGFRPERLVGNDLDARFPAFSKEKYPDGFYQPVAGYVESGRAVALLAAHARRLGIHVEEGQTAAEIIIWQGRATGVKTEEGSAYSAGTVIVCAGNFTPYLLPELRPFFRITGHPIFHLKPEHPDLFTADRFPVFAADIANTGWYGFPFHPKEKVVKVALHAQGLELHPIHDERVVGPEDLALLRSFLRESIPPLADAPLVYTHRCCYTDTLDGHFWICPHPSVEGLVIGSGGSGHGFKMGPAVGKMIADTATGRSHKWSDRYGWRTLGSDTVQREEARCL